MAKTSADTLIISGAPIPYIPMTELGKGFLPLLIRSWIRSIIVANAVFQKFGISYEVALAELNEGREYLGRIDYKTTDIVNPKTSAQIEYLRGLYNEMYGSIEREGASKPKEIVSQDTLLTIRPLTDGMFALLAQLDRDLLGLTGNQTDAGQKL